VSSHGSGGVADGKSPSTSSTLRRSLLQYRYRSSRPSCVVCIGVPRRQHCQDDKSAVSDGVEDQRAEEALMGQKKAKNHHVSFGKSRLSRERRVLSARCDTGIRTTDAKYCSRSLSCSSVAQWLSTSKKWRRGQLELTSKLPATSVRIDTELVGVPPGPCRNTKRRCSTFSTPHSSAEFFVPCQFSARVQLPS
jgi:hypothetical protein